MTTVSSPPPAVTPTTIEKLPANIPRLESNGSNWAIFKMRFSNAMKVTRRWAYFTGILPCPEPADASKPTKDEAELIVQWEYEDSVASYLLSQRLPDTTEMCLASCSTTKERWDMVTKEYQAKSAYAQADLHQAFLEMRCAKGGDVREFLASLGCKREELAAAGVLVTEKEYERTILRGIPSELATFASHLMSSALIVHGAKSVDLDALINQICEEADRLKNRRPKGQGGKKDSTTDEALSATASDDGKRRRRRGKCHNCGKFGHWAKECRSAKKDKEESAGTQAAQASSTSTSTALPPSRRTSQWGPPTSSMISKVMGFGWPKKWPLTARILCATSQIRCWVHQTTLKRHHIARGRRKMGRSKKDGSRR